MRKGFDERRVSPYKTTLTTPHLLVFTVWHEKEENQKIVLLYFNDCLFTSRSEEIQEVR